MFTEPKPGSLWYLVILAVALIGGCGDSVPSWTVDEAQFVYTLRSGGAPHLYRFEAATGTSTRLIPDSAPTWDGRVSPDGTQLAYLTTRDGNYEIYIRGLSSSGRGVNVTNHPDYDVLPAWSPDGNRLAFMSTRGFTLGELGPFPGHIYVAELDGSALRQVTKEPLTSSLGPGSWSPDGRYLVLSRSIDDQLDLFLLDVDDGTERRLTTNQQTEYSAEFSRDGLRLAFHAETDSSSQIVVIDLDGTHRRVLTRGPGFRYTPRWSPDDSWLLYTARGEGDQYDLRAVRVEDGLDIPILATDEDEREGDWLPGPAGFRP